MKRLLLIALIIILVLGGVLAGAAGWVLHTRSGAVWALSTAQRYLPSTMSLQAEIAPDSSISGPLVLDQLHFANDSVDVQARQITLDWDLWRLLSGRLEVRRLSADGLQIHQKASNAPPPPKSDEPLSVPASLPLGINLKALQITDLSVADADGNTLFEDPRIDARIRWVGRRLDIRYVRTSLPQTGPLQLSARLQMAEDGAELTPLIVSGPGRIQLEGHLAWAGDSDLRLSWEKLNWPVTGDPMVSSASGNATLRGTPEDLKFTIKGLVGPNGSINGEGAYNGALQAKLSWDKLGWPLVAEKPEWSSQHGELDASGTPDQYQFRISAQAAGPVLNKPVVIDGSGSGSTEQVTLDSLAARADKSQLMLKGSVGFSGTMPVQASGSFQQLDPSLVMPDYPAALDGSFEADGALAAGERVNFKFKLDKAQWQGHSYAASASGWRQDDNVTLDEAQLKAGDSVLTAKGRVTAPFNVSARLDSPDLGDLWPGLGGSVKLSANFSGSLQQPAVKLSLEGSNLIYQELPQIRSAKVNGHLDPDGQLQLDADIASLQPALGGEAALSLRLDGSLAQHRLALALSSEPFDSVIKLEGGLDKNKQSWSGSLTELRVEPKNRDAWSLSEAVPLTASAQAASLKGLCVASKQGKLCADADWNAPSYSARLDIHNLDMRFLRPWMPEGLRLDSMLNGGGTVKGQTGAVPDMDLALTLDPGEVRSDRKTLLTFDKATVSARTENGAVHLVANWPHQYGKLDLDATVGLADPIDSAPLGGHLSLKLDQLDWLANLSPELDSAKGRFDAEFDLGGTVSAPVIDGNATLSDGNVALQSAGIEISQLTARVTGSADGKLRFEASGKSGDGELKISGSSENFSTLDLSITGDNFMAADRTDARVWISPDLKLTQANGLWSVTGKVVVPKASITPVGGSDNGVAPSTDQVLVDSSGKEIGQSPLQLHADLRVELGDKVNFEGFGLKTRLEGGLNVYEDPDRDTTARGEIRLIDGKYQAYGQDLSIETGRLIYTGSVLTRPAIEIRATRKPTDEITVGVQVRGTLDAPEFSLTSTPTMSRQEQLSWLVLGHSLESGGSDDDRSMLASAALSLGLGGASKLAQGLKNGLGIDQISIGSQPGETNNQAMLTVGKYLSPGLFISYGVGLFQPGYRFLITYDITHRLKFSGETGVENGGDLIYSFEHN